MPSDGETSILMISDDPNTVDHVKSQLKRASNGTCYYIETATDLTQGVARASDAAFDLILLDISAPGGLYAGVVEQLQAIAMARPLIILSEADNETEAMAAVRKGAQDFLIKQETPPGVLARAIKYAIYRKAAEHKLTETIAALKAANEKIAEQQKSIIEEERLKVLLQMAGATSHELNQPITSLLGTIEVMRLEPEVPKEWAEHVDRIEAAGRRIADIVRKMRTIRSVSPTPSADSKALPFTDRIIRVLAIEDTDIDYEQIKAHVAQQKQIAFARARSKAEAIERLKAETFDLVFLDYLLPDGSGIELLEWMDREQVQVPVIAITGHGDEIVATQMIKAGSFDYLPKASIKEETLTRCIANVLERFQLKKEVEQATRKVVQMATRDPLTNLYNRNYLNDTLEKEVSRARRYQSELACLLLDLDYFKEVNDTFGHRFGDVVLRQFARCLADNIRDTDTAFRYGGEEFLILLPQTDTTGARRIAEKLRALVAAKRFADEQTSTPLTVSIGIASISQIPSGGTKDLLACADKALYHAKAEGRNRVNVYQKDMSVISPENRFRYIKERMTALMEKTKRASVESVELMAHDMGGDRFKTHNQRVVRMLEQFGTRLNFSQPVIKTLQRAAIFHDFTKVLLGDFHDKAHLDQEEEAEIKNHPYTMAQLMEPLDLFADERTTLLWHHENFDGSGYPDGLQGEEIPLGARVLAVVDALVAMTSHRPYKKNNSAEEVIRELAGNAGTQFDPMLVKQLLAMIEEEKLLAVSGHFLKDAREQLRNKELERER